MIYVTCYILYIIDVTLRWKLDNSWPISSPIIMENKVNV